MEKYNSYFVPINQRQIQTSTCHLISLLSFLFITLSFTAKAEAVSCGALSSSEINITDVSAYSVTVNWVDQNAQRYYVYYREVGTNSGWIYDGNTTSTNRTIDALIDQTDYEIRIRTKCPNNNTFYWSDIVDFSTGAFCGGYSCTQMPVSNITQTSATISWPLADLNGGYQILYIRPVGGNYVSYPLTTYQTSILIPNLQVGTTYDFFIFSNCFSYLIDSEDCQFTTQSTACGAHTVAELSHDNISCTSVNISWVDKNAERYYLYYRLRNTNSSWTYAGNTTGTNLQLIGLKRYRNYEYRVRTKCPNDGSYYWSEIDFFTACLENSIISNTEEATTISLSQKEEANTASLFPNPVTDQLSIGQSEPMETVLLLNAQGQQLRAIDAQKENKIVLDLSDLASGIYFIRIDANQPEKFFKQ